MAKRAPPSGIRISGRTYRSGEALPEHYERDLPKGQVHADPANGIPDAPPNLGRYTVPHILTFSGRIGNIARAYRNADEAMRHSQQNAIAMRKDCAIMECVEARQRGVALLDWHLEGDRPKDPEQMKAVAELTSIIESIPDFTEYRRNLQEAIWYGRYAVENVFGFDYVTGRKRTIVKAWQPRHGDKLLFRYDDGTGDYDPDQIGVRLLYAGDAGDVIAGNRKLELTSQGMGYFLEPWERSRFVVHKHMIEDAAYEDPYSSGTIHGVGIRSRIYWTWFQQAETLAQLMEVVEKTGQGFVIYRFPAADPTAQEAMQRIANEQTHSNYILIPSVAGDPDAYSVDVVPANTAGIDALREIVKEFFGNRIKRYILGQTLTSETEATGMGSTVADLHLETFLSILRYDALKQAETLTRQLVWPLCRLNPRLAQYEGRIRFILETQEDETDKKLQGIRQGWDMGLRIKATDVWDMLGLSAPTVDDEILQNPSMAGGGGMPGMPPGAGPGGMPPGGGMPPAGPDGGDGGEPPSDQDLFGPLAGGDPQGGDEPQDEGDEAEQYARANAILQAQVEHAASQTDDDPTEAQREAGNYAKGKCRIHGMTIAIETPAGAERCGVSDDGKAWSVTLPHHYGYVLRSEGNDGDHVDCFLGPDLDSRIVYVVDQSPPGGRGFDEHKAMIGFKSEADAKQAYLDSYSDGFGAEIFRDLTPMSVDEFREWLADGNQTRPIADQYARGAADDEGGAFILGDPDTAEAYAKKYKPSAGQSSMFDESKHPRQADGEFAPKGGGSVHEAGGEDEEFSLSNPAPKHKPAEFENAGGRQGKLLSGLNLLPGQQDLFAVDGEEAEKPAPSKHDELLAAGHTFEGRKGEDAYYRSPGGQDISRVGPSGMARWHSTAASWDSIGKKLALGEDADEPPSDTATPAEATAEKAAEAGKGDDKKRIGKDGTTYIRAPKGGGISDVNGQHYKGGRWMPIHGLSAGHDKPKPVEPKQKGSDPPPPNENAKQRTARQPMTPEEIADEKERRENESRWSEVKQGPLNDLLGLGERPHFLRHTRGGTKRWQGMTEKHGLTNEHMQQLADYLEPKVIADHAADIDAHPWKITKSGGSWKEMTKDEALANVKESLANNAKMDEEYHTKKYLKTHPDSPYANQLLGEYLGRDQGKRLHELHTVLGKLKAGDPINEADEKATPADPAAQQGEEPEAHDEPSHEEKAGLVKHAIDIDRESIFASGQKRSKFPTAQSISVKAMEGANAIWHHQGDPDQTRFNAAQSDASDLTKKTAAQIEAAHAAGYRLKNHRAGKYGTLWVFEKDGRILTERGAEALANGTGAIDLPKATERETAKPIIDAVDSFVKTLPDSTRGNLGALTAAINRSPLGKHVTIARDDNGSLRLTAKDGNWHIYEPSHGHDASGEYHRNLESSLPRFLAKLDHMAANDIPEGNGEWASHDRRADEHAVATEPPMSAKPAAAPEATDPLESQWRLFRKPDGTLIAAGRHETGISLSAKQQGWKKVADNISREEALAKRDAAAKKKRPDGYSKEYPA